MNEITINKIIKMFRPCERKMFLGYDGENTICSPNDRAMCGFDNYFPKEWLIEDWDFTEEEATWFINKVKELNKDE